MSKMYKKILRAALPYLNFFKITDHLINGAKNSSLDLNELAKLISNKKALFLSNTFSTRLSVPIFLLFFFRKKKV